MKNRLAAFSRKIIPYNPEFRKLSLVRSVNSALLLQQLDFWFDKHNTFWKFIEAAPNHYQYKEGDSWTEELGMSKDEFRTAFATIGIAYKSKNQFRDAENKFIQTDSYGNQTEYYYASYIDRQQNLTFYIRNDDLLDRELAELVQSSSLKNRVRPDKPVPENHDENTLHGTLRTSDPVIAPVTTEAPKSAKAPKRTAEEIAAEKAAKAEAERLKKEKRERDNQARYEFFGDKDRYNRFNGWFWGFYIPGTSLTKPDMFYSVMMKDLLAGGEKYRYLVSMFDQAERKVAEEAKAKQEQDRMDAVVKNAEDQTDEDFEAMLSIEECQALVAANLDADAYSFLLRRLVGQPDHKFRMTIIEREKDRQEFRNQQRAKLAD